MDTLPPTPAPITCRRCRCTSTLPQFFQKGAAGPLCPTCAAKLNLRQNQIIYGISFGLIFINLVGVWVLTGRPGQLGLDLLAVFAIMLLLLIGHELSHAGVARLLGGRVFGIHLGIGTLLIQRWFGNFYVGVSLLPAGGFCFLGFPPQRWIRLRYGLTVFAGPLFHLLLLFLLLPAMRITAEMLPAKWVLQTFSVNAILLVINLLPFLKVHTTMGSVQSDGNQLWRLLRGKLTVAQIEQGYYNVATSFALRQQRNEQAWVELKQGLMRYPDSQVMRNLHGYLLLHSEELEASLAIWQELIDAPTDATTGPELQPLLQAIHYNNYAWVLLLRRSTPEELTVAGAYAERAFAMAPWITPLRGTLAAALVARGETEAGIEKALAAAEEYQRDPNPIAQENRGITLATAALGYAHLGKPAEALRLLAQAQHLAPKALAVRQVIAEIEGRATTAPASPLSPASQSVSPDDGPDGR